MNEIEFDCIDDLFRHLNEKGEGEGYETLEDVLNFDNHFKPKSKDNNGINFIRFTTVLAHMVLLEAAWECAKYNSKWWKNKRLELETLYKKHIDYVL